MTLTGPGGVGKTALAVAAAHAVAGQFGDGTAFISLETLTDPALIRETVAHQLRIPTPPGPDGHRKPGRFPSALASLLDRHRQC